MPGLRRLRPHLLCFSSRDGTLVFGKQSGVEALFQDWQPIFCGDPDETLAVDKYRRLYDPFILQSDGFSVPELDVADLRKAAQKAQKTAAGCDGWSAALLLVLPDQAWLQLVDILTRCETDAVWPDGMLAWRVVYLPKEVKSGATSTMKVRPDCHRPCALPAVVQREGASTRSRFAIKI